MHDGDLASRKTEIDARGPQEEERYFGKAKGWYGAPLTQGTFLLSPKVKVALCGQKCPAATDAAMGGKRSARAPPPSTPSDAENILPADAKVSPAPMPPDQRGVAVGAPDDKGEPENSNPRSRLPEAARGAVASHDGAPQTARVCPGRAHFR